MLNRVYSITVFQVISDKLSINILSIIIMNYIIYGNKKHNAMEMEARVCRKEFMILSIVLHNNSS